MSSKSAFATAEYVGNSKVRLGLLVSLITGPKSTSQLATIENRHVSHISRALTELKARGVVEPMPRGSRETFYKLTTQGYVIYTVLSRAR